MRIIVCLVPVKDPSSRTDGVAVLSAVRDVIHQRLASPDLVRQRHEDAFHVIGLAVIFGGCFEQRHTVIVGEPEKRVRIASPGLVKGNDGVFLSPLRFVGGDGHIANVLALVANHNHWHFAHETVSSTLIYPEGHRQERGSSGKKHVSLT